MITARQKRKENIVEYLLYMWQVEDMIRASHLDMDLMEARIISKYDQPEEVKREIRLWYQDLADMMRTEGIAEKGHIQINRNVVAELTDLHHRLLRDPLETIYGSLYYQTLPAIVQLRAKSGGNGAVSEIETCLTAIYGYFWLKIQEKDISVETQEGIKRISKMLAFLAFRFHEGENPIRYGKNSKD